MARAREENRWDIELFGRARHAEASILRRVGCMARHLAPAGVDDDWESALASAAVGLALLYVFWTKRRGGFSNLRTAFAPLPGTPSAFDSPFGGAA